MNRRQLLQSTAAATVALARGGRLLSAEAQPSTEPATPSAKAPFRVLYGNDVTNVTSCVSPYHKAGEPFRPQMLEASVDETAGRGIDAHVLQPGLGMVPMWPSKVLPVREHYDWVKARYGLDPDTFGRYVLAGGDVVRVFIDRCRLRGQAAFVSLRLNDAHNKEHAAARRGDPIPGGAAMSLTRFYVEHPEYRVGPDPRRVMERGQNWAIPEVRAHRFALVRELCENYDLDGFELDFMRFPSFFPQDRTTVDERRGIITAFVRQVRDLLDATARHGRRRWLCARVPCYLKAYDPLGLDLPAMAAAGLDMVNVSASYFTVQQSDFAAIRRSVPAASVYAELCHSTWNGRSVAAGYDAHTFRRTTAEQYYTAAHLAYARGGADGVSAFNFAYYREHGAPGRGPFNEPPFEVFARLRDPAWLARRPQHYLLAPGWDNAFVRPPILPRAVEAGKTVTFTLDLAEPEGGWKQGGRLRIQGEESLGDGRWRCRLNGRELPASDDVSEPYPNPYPPMLGKPEALRAWSVPVEVLRDGANAVELALAAGTGARVALIDLAVG